MKGHFGHCGLRSKAYPVIKSVWKHIWYSVYWHILSCSFASGGLTEKYTKLFRMTTLVYIADEWETRALVPA